MFRALRELLLSGNIKGLLDGSRRQARLLAQFSPEFGQRSVPLSADEYVMRETARRGAPGNLTPDDIWDARALDFGGSFDGTSPSGGRVYIYDDGQRYRPAPNMYSPIVSPYEGMRVWGGADDGFPNSIGAPPPWMGRGEPPIPTSRTMYASDAGDEFPSAYPRSPYDEPFTMYEPAPSYYFGDPARNFGGYGSPLYGDNVPRAFWDRPYGYNFPPASGRIRGWDY